MNEDDLTCLPPACASHADRRRRRRACLSAGRRQERAESILMSQAQLLDAIFNDLAQRAINAQGMNTLDRTLRLALRAQSQCRATLETFTAGFARAPGVEAALEGEPLVEPLRKLADRGGWEGKATDLCNRLNELAGLNEVKRRPDGWPKNAKSLGHQLKRLAPALRAQKLEVKKLPKDRVGNRCWRVIDCAQEDGKGNAVNADPSLAQGYQ